MSSVESRGRYAVVVRGIGLLLPKDVFCEFVAHAEVTPVPGLAAGVLGITQVRGQTRWVLDGSGETRVGPGHALLLLGEEADAGAVSVAAQPSIPVLRGELAAEVCAEARQRIAPAMRRALQGAFEGDDGRLWWQFERDRLLEGLIDGVPG